MLNLNFNPFPEIRTQDIVLRNLRMDDAPAVFHLRSHPEVLKYLDRPPAGSLAEAELWIETVLKGTAANTSINWAVCLPTNERLLGTMAFWKIDETNHRAEIGYTLDPEWQGKGLMSRAMQEVLLYGFHVMNLHGIDANVNPKNQKSINLLTRFGFQKEAHFKENYYFDGKYLDSAIYCLLRDSARL
ncbi:MAG: GNAT family N-acetyltransferase [Saprospiraceae bacterium]|nr:GNAT family N-acetyltransferase [Saprospiraceae bacterium]